MKLCCDEQIQNVNKGRDVAKLNTRESGCVSQWKAGTLLSFPNVGGQ